MTSASSFSTVPVQRDPLDDSSPISHVDTPRHSGRSVLVQLAVLNHSNRKTHYLFEMLARAQYTLPQVNNGNTYMYYIYINICMATSVLQLQNCFAPTGYRAMFTPEYMQNT